MSQTLTQLIMAEVGRQMTPVRLLERFTIMATGSGELSLASTRGVTLDVRRVVLLYYTQPDDMQARGIVTVKLFSCVGYAENELVGQYAETIDESTVKGFVEKIFEHLDSSMRGITPAPVKRAGVLSSDSNLH